MPFVTLSNEEYTKLIAIGDSFVIRYYLYIKYYCGYSKSKTNDFTAKQYLEVCGYSCNSDNMLGKVYKANNRLLRDRLIDIKKYRDEQGHERNIYKVTCK